MKHRAPWRRSACAIVAALALFSAGTRSSLAQTPPPWTVSVSGQPVTLTDVFNAMTLWFAGSSLQPVPKDRKQMPTFAPYAWCAGRDKDEKATEWTAGPPERQKNLPETERAEITREYREASILLALELGAGGPTWQRLYHGLPDDPEKRNAFAGEIVDAMTAASAWTVAKSAADRRWIFANVQAGLTRQQVSTLLGTREFSATDLSARGTKLPSGLAYVELPGYFEPGCSFTNRITITFDANGRVKKLDLSPPHPNCL